MTDSKLGTFLLHYFTCEVLANLLQGARARQSPADSLRPGKNVNRNRLDAALAQFGIKISPTTLDQIFQSQRTAVSKKSARLLRNAAVHEMNELDIAEINRRGGRLVRVMKTFINKIDGATQISTKF